VKWSRASVLPRVSPRPKRGGLLSPSRADTLCRSKNGGLCGHCSRDVDEFASRLTRPLGLRSAQSVSRRLRRSAPLDRRLLFVAELTGQKWWVVSVTLRRWSVWTSALQAARDLYAATNPMLVAGHGMRRAVSPTAIVAERSPHGRRSVNRTTIRELMRLP
jgi:hypothetical protein